MKKTPAEQKALEAARKIRPVPVAQYMAIRRTPEKQRTVEQTRTMLEDDLRQAAETFEHREWENERYRECLKKGDRSEARWHAPSPLQDSTAKLRRDLVEAWKELAEFERMPLAPRVGKESKRWGKTKRFFTLMEIQRQIERNGGKVRYRQRPRKRDIIYSRVFAADNQKTNRAPGPLQMALGV